MQTDKEKFIALMSEFGLAPTEDVDDTINYTFEKPQPKVIGYASSVAIFSFELDGSFKEVGVWD